MSPVALARVAEIDATDRYVPGFLAGDRRRQQLQRTDLQHPRDRRPAAVCRTRSVDERQRRPGLVSRTADSSSRLYSWAEDLPNNNGFRRRSASQPGGRDDRLRRFGRRRRGRKALRANESSTPSRTRKLGRSQLRIGMFPAIDPDDVSALTAHVRGGRPLTWTHPSGLRVYPLDGWGALQI